MNDQTPPWEDNWRDTLADYEAPLQPTDWAAMDALLDGGTQAPPEAASPGPAAVGFTVTKMFLIGIGIFLLSGLAYVLGRSDGASEVMNNTAAKVMIDSIPNEEIRQDRIVRTPEEPQEAGERRSPENPRTTPPTDGLETSPDALDAPASVLDPAPAAAPVPAESPEEQTIIQQRLNNPRTRPVYPILSRPPTGFPGFDELLRLRLEKAIREHPVEIVPSPVNNGYFPPVKGQY